MTAIYVDATMPDDTGNGLTTGTAKRTPRAAQNLSVAGDIILVKTGLCYAPSGGLFMFFSGVSNVTIDSYGTASDKPMFDGLTYENPGAAGWTYISDGIWKKTFGPTFIRRLWVGSRSSGSLITQRVLGDAKRRATGVALLTGAPTAPNPLTEAIVLPTLSTHDIWFGAGAALSYALYVYTGTAAIDPPTYYDGLAFIQADNSTVGGINGIYVENQTYIHASNIHFRGMGAYGIRLAAQNSNTRDVANCLFEDCTVTAPYQGAFLSRITGQLSPTRRVTGTTARRIYCDYESSPDEQEPDVTYGYLSGASDLFSISDGSIGITVEGCTAINSSHNGLVIGSAAMRTTPPIGSRLLYNTVFYDLWQTYGRGISTLDGEQGIVSGNKIINQNTRSQLQGAARIIGNVWYNLRPSVRKPIVGQWVAIESYMYPGFQSGLSAEGYIRINPIAMVISNNVVYGPPELTAIIMNYFQTPIGDAGHTFSAGAVTVQNNIIYLPTGKFVTTMEETGKTIGQQTFTNNTIYNATVGDSKFTWRLTNYTINAAPGASGNNERHPHLDYNHLPGDVLMRTGGVAIEGRDYYGKEFQTAAPIGAVIAQPNITVVSRSVVARTVVTRNRAPRTPSGG